MPFRDVTTGKFQVRPHQWWAESAPPGWNRVRVSENLGATAVAPVAPVDTLPVIDMGQRAKFSTENSSLDLSKPI